jgi:hypothetical protein
MVRSLGVDLRLTTGGSEADARALRPPGAETVHPAVVRLCPRLPAVNCPYFPALSLPPAPRPLLPV